MTDDLSSTGSAENDLCILEIIQGEMKTMHLARGVFPISLTAG